MFDFAPKLLFVYNSNTYSPYSNAVQVGIFFLKDDTPFFVGLHEMGMIRGENTVSIFENTVSWYHSQRPETQLNYADANVESRRGVYRYVAIG